MARGKHASAAANRRAAAAEQRVAELEAEVAALKKSAHERELARKDEIRAEVDAATLHTVEYVESLLTKRAETLHAGMSNAVWRAQRVAMTEHLAWLFFKGYITWNRLEGDREALTFIATHGDLAAWWTLTGKYGHRKNHKDRRADKRHHPVQLMLATLRDIDRASRGDQALRASREALDGVVDYARSAFVDVELSAMMTDEGWQMTQPTDDDVVLHREMLDSLPEFERVAERVG